MKTLLSAVALLAFIGLLFFGCADEQMQPVQSSSGTLQKQSNGQGAGILRYEEENAYGFIDEDAHLLLVLGINNPSDFCSGIGGMDIFKVKDILLPNADPELRREIMQINCGDVTAIIWQSDEWPADFCDFILNTNPLAIGSANFRYRDNDFWAWWQNNPNANAFGYRANGTMDGPNGEKYNLNFFYKITWDGVATNYMENLNTHLVLRGN